MARVREADLAGAEVFASVFGFTTVLRTSTELHLRGTDAGAPCVIIRQRPRSRFLGPAFHAAGSVDLLRLAEDMAVEVVGLPEEIGGLREARAVFEASRDDNEFDLRRLRGLLKVASS